MCVACQKSEDRTQQKNESPEKLIVSSVSSDVTESVIETDRAVFSGNVTLQGLRGSADLRANDFWMETSRYVSSRKDHQFENLKWLGQSVGAAVISDENTMSLGFGGVFNFQTDDDKIRPSDDRYLTTLIKVTDRSGEEVFFQTWTTVEIPWEIETGR